MKNKFMKVMSVVLATSLVVGLCFVCFGNKAAANQKVVYKYVYDESDPLLAATHFHLFAQESIDSSAHTHGNVACKVYSGSPDFGSRPQYYENNTTTEITYIRTLLSINPNTEAGTLVLGNQYSITSPENSGQTVVTDGKDSFTFNHIAYKNILIEPADSNVLDLDKEFIKLRNLSNVWSKCEPTGEIVPELADENNRYIDFSQIDMSEGIKFVNLDKDILSQDRPLAFTGLTKEGNGIVVINVDLAGTESFTVNTTQIKAQFTDGTEASNSEIGPDNFGEVRVAFNFYDSSKTDRNYTGTIDFSRGVIFTSILAPSADLTVGAINGTAVAKNIVHTGGQSHRRDIVKGNGSIKQEVVVDDTTVSSTVITPSTEATSEKETTDPGKEEGTTEKNTIENNTDSTTKATQSTTKAADTTKATQSTTKAADTTKATQSTTKAADTTKATQSTTKAADTTKATQSTTKAADTTKATQSTTKAADTTKATQSTTKAADTTKATQSTTKAQVTTKAPETTTKQVTQPTTKATLLPTKKPEIEPTTIFRPTDQATTKASETTTKASATTKAADNTTSEQKTNAGVVDGTSEEITTKKSDDVTVTSKTGADATADNNSDPENNDTKKDAQNGIAGGVSDDNGTTASNGKKPAVAADEDEVPNTGDADSVLPYALLVLGSMTGLYIVIKRK